MTNLLASIPNDKVNNTKKLTFQKNDTTRVYFSQRQIDDLNDNGYVKVFDHTIYLHDLTAQQHFPINKNIKQDKHHVTPVTPTNANDIYKQKAARFLFTWKYLKNKRYANLNIDIQHAFAFASIDTTYVKKYLKKKTFTTIKPITFVEVTNTTTQAPTTAPKQALRIINIYLDTDNKANKDQLLKYYHENIKTVQTLFDIYNNIEDEQFIKVVTLILEELSKKRWNEDDQLFNVYKDWEAIGGSLDVFLDIFKQNNPKVKQYLYDKFKEEEDADIDALQNKFSISTGVLQDVLSKLNPFSYTEAEKSNQLLPTTWSWEVTEDIQVVIKYICTNKDGLKELAWKYGDAYVRVREIKERMLRIPLVGMPTKCRLKDEGVNDKKIYTFCCLLLLAESYGVPLIRVADWEIVNKTWMMMLHQYRNITNEDGYWLVKGDLSGDESKKGIFHGGRLLELVVRMYNLRVTQDDNNALKLFKYGVNNYRMYLEKYMEKMQPFMAPIEVSEKDHIVDVLIKQGWSHPKRVVEDVIEPFCENVSKLFGFDGDFKIVYNDYFDS